MVSVKERRWHKHTDVCFSPVMANLDAGSCWRRCPVQWHRGGGLCCFGVFLKEKHGRSRWPRGIPFVGRMHAEGRKRLSLGQEILAGVCTPRSHGPSSSRKGGLGDESLVKIWSDQFQFHLTVGAIVHSFTEQLTHTRLVLVPLLEYLDLSLSS